MGLAFFQPSPEQQNTNTPATAVTLRIGELSIINRLGDFIEARRIDWLDLAVIGLPPSQDTVVTFRALDQVAAVARLSD